MLVLLLYATTVGAQDETVQPEAAQAVPSSTEVARVALDPRQRSLLELQQLQLRENELWQVRDRESMTWPAIGLGLGVTGAATMIPFGSVFVAVAGTSSSNPTYDGEPSDDDGSEKSFRTVGGMLLGLGVVALLVSVYSGIRVRALRTTRRAADQELSAIRQRRIRMIDALALPSEPRRAH